MQNNNFVQQVKVVSTQAKVRDHVHLSEMSFFDTNGNSVELVNRQSVYVANIVTPDATDLPTAITLANANKAKLNGLLTALKNAGLMAPS